MEKFIWNLKPAELPLVVGRFSKLKPTQTAGALCWVRWEAERRSPIRGQCE